MVYERVRRTDGSRGEFVRRTPDGGSVMNAYEADCGVVIDLDSPYMCKQDAMGLGLDDLADHIEAYSSLIADLDNTDDEENRLASLCGQALRNLKSAKSALVRRQEDLGNVLSANGLRHCHTYDDLVRCLVRCGFDVACLGGNPTTWANENMSDICEQIWEVG